MTKKILNRKIYKSVKKMDRQEMEKFLKDIYRCPFLLGGGKMELKELVEKTKELFEIDDISSLSFKLQDVVLNNKTEYYRAFKSLVVDLSIDWLQKIFQYYEADRVNKKQDYTPASLARFVAKLSSNNEDTVIDMCAGSGALTIQKWNENKNLKFICEEFDSRVIPFLIFNLALRNIEGVVIHRDVLMNEEYKRYVLTKGEEFSKVEEINR